MISASLHTTTTPGVLARVLALHPAPDGNGGAGPGPRLCTCAAFRHSLLLPFGGIILRFVSAHL